VGRIEAESTFPDAVIFTTGTPSIFDKTGLDLVGVVNQSDNIILASGSVYVSRWTGSVQRHPYESQSSQGGS
jgi:hypothetical protein